MDLLDYGYNNFKLVDIGVADYITSGGKVIIPSTADVKDCTVEVEEYEDPTAGKMVNWVYYYSGHRVGNILMTAENADAYEKYLLKEKEKAEKKDESKANKKNNKNNNTKKTDESSADSGKDSSVSGGTEKAGTEKNDGILPKEVKAEKDHESNLRSILKKIIIGLVIFIIVFVVAMSTALNIIRNKKRRRKKRKRRK